MLYTRCYCELVTNVVYNNFQDTGILATVGLVTNVYNNFQDTSILATVSLVTNVVYNNFQSLGAIQYSREYNKFLNPLQPLILLNLFLTEEDIRRKLVSVKMGCLVAVTIVLSLSGWCCAQAPGDEDPHCTETLPSLGVNILDYPPEVKPLMDSHNYRQLLPPVWQQVDNDNNNPSGVTTNVSSCTGYIHFVSAT